MVISVILNKFCDFLDLRKHNLSLPRCKIKLPVNWRNDLVIKSQSPYESKPAPETIASKLKSLFLCFCLLRNFTCISYTICTPTCKSFNLTPAATDTKTCFSERIGFNCDTTFLTALKKVSRTEESPPIFKASNKYEKAINLAIAVSLA